MCMSYTYLQCPYAICVCRTQNYNVRMHIATGLMIKNIVQSVSKILRVEEWWSHYRLWREGNMQGKDVNSIKWFYLYLVKVLDKI